MANEIVRAPAKAPDANKHGCLVVIGRQQLPPDVEGEAVVFSTLYRRYKKNKAFRQGKGGRRSGPAGSELDDVCHIAKLGGMRDHASLRGRQAFRTGKSFQIFSRVLADADEEVGQAVRLLQKYSEYFCGPLIAGFACVDRYQIVGDANKPGVELTFDFSYLIKIIGIDPR